MQPTLPRRAFLARTSSAALGLGLSARTMARAQGANERVVMGVIGSGGMGRSNMGGLLKVPGVEFAAVCDVDEKQANEGVASSPRPGEKNRRCIAIFANCWIARTLTQSCSRPGITGK